MAVVIVILLLLLGASAYYDVHLSTSTTTVTTTATTTLTATLVTSATSGSETTQYSISFFPTEWMCGEQIQVTFSGFTSQEMGHQIQFQYFSSGSGAGNGEQTSLLWTDLQYVTGSSITYMIQPTEWEDFSFEFQSSLFVVVTDLNLPQNGVSSTILLSQIVPIEGIPETCTGQATFAFLSESLSKPTIVLSILGMVLILIVVVGILLFLLLRKRKR
jgi:hypothetical protein